MGDLKLFYINFVFQFELFLFSIVSFIIENFDNYYQNGLYLFNFKIYYQFPQNSTIVFGIKFCLSIAFLILIRGGTPRYRYDYLTKLGWLKFLGFIILAFFLSILTFFLF